MDNKFAGKTIHSVVETYSDLLIRIAFQYTGSTTDAEYIVKEVYKKLMKYRKAFTHSNDMKVWLIRQAIKGSKLYMRSKNKNELRCLKLYEDDLLNKLFRLEEDERIILFLHDYEGFTIEQVKAMLFKRGAQVITILESGRSKLNASFDKEGVI
ncbi:RNA polymerase sigma factor [Acidaminobacter sp. JC074]|uniref:RNA polymerase sigma factor n=1 Tax=Acidaminobacter sp. JC074 TaxID=2530199 RepID=UPI001F10D168|nr:sigma factor [Acidaminobacter sp. JC074]